MLRIITRFPERHGGGIFLSHLEVASFLRRVRGNQRQQFVTFYEISTSVVVEFISSLAATRGEGDRGASYFRVFFLFFLSLPP